MGFYPSEGDIDSNGAEEVNLRSAAGAELLGQQVSAASLPVVIATDQSAVPISAASLPLPTGAATAALQTTGNASLAAIDAGIPAALGQTTMAASMPIVVASNQSAIPIAITGNNSFAVSGERTAIGTTELPLLLFRNPTGSIRTVFPKTLIVANRHTVSSFIVFRVYASPTVTTTGTALVEASTNLGAGVAIAADAFTSPTVSGNGTLIALAVAPGGAAGVSVTVDLLPKFSMADNTALLITATSDGAGRIACASVFWEEV